MDLFLATRSARPMTRRMLWAYLPQLHVDSTDSRISRRNETDLSNPRAKSPWSPLQCSSKSVKVRSFSWRSLDPDDAPPRLGGKATVLFLLVRLFAAML